MAANQSTTHGIVNQNERPEPDQVLKDIADYVHNYKIDSPLAVSPPPGYLVTAQANSVVLVAPESLSPRCGADLNVVG